MKFWKIEFREEVDSTNDELKKLMRKGEAINGLVICSAHQTNGKGQRGNSWESVPGKNLQMSFGFIPKNLRADEMHLLHQWVSVSIYRMLQNIGLHEVKIKWPNDILVREQKICGILIENGVGGKGVEESVIGIGLNVNHGPKSIGATCIAEQLGIELSVKNVMHKLLAELEKGLFDIRKNASKIHREYLQNLHGFEQPVRIILKGEEALATVQEVRANGEIEIRVGEVSYNLGFKEFEWIIRH